MVCNGQLCIPLNLHAVTAARRDRLLLDIATL